MGHNTLITHSFKRTEKVLVMKKLAKHYKIWFRGEPSGARSIKVEHFVKVNVSEVLESQALSLSSSWLDLSPVFPISHLFLAVFKLPLFASNRIIITASFPPLPSSTLCLQRQGFDHKSGPDLGRYHLPPRGLETQTPLASPRKIFQPKSSNIIYLFV